MTTNQTQLIERQLGHLSEQKSEAHAKLHEITNSLLEVEKTEKAYKILAGVMVAADKATLLEELNLQKEKVEKKIELLSEQEATLAQKLETAVKDENHEK